METVVIGTLTATFQYGIYAGGKSEAIVKVLRTFIWRRFHYQQLNPQSAFTSLSVTGLAILYEGQKTATTNRRMTNRQWIETDITVANKVTLREIVAPRNHIKSRNDTPHDDRQQPTECFECNLKFERRNCRHTGHNVRACGLKQKQASANGNALYSKRETIGNK